MSKKTSKYQNDDGSFKEMQRPGSDHASAFNGCVLHMQHEEGHPEDSATRICGAIAQASAGVTDLPDDSAVAAARMTGPMNIVGGRDGTVVLQYMPPGQQTVSPFVNGEAMEMKVNVTSSWADVFERANQSLLAKAKAGLDNEPFTDFNHDDDRASSKPQRYYWGGTDPKTGGVLLETKLTASGKAGITKTADTEPDYSSFSPQWIFHKKTFEPLGLPINQGAFVNRAAFKKIGKLPVVSAKNGSRSWALGTGGGGSAASNDATSDTNGNCPDCGDLSAAAHKASSKAMTADDADGFNAHSSAFQGHKEAEAANRIAGNDDAAEHHQEMMNFHKKQANKFAKHALAGSREPAANNKNTKGNDEMTKEELASAMASAFAAPEFATAVNGVVSAAVKPLTEKITALEKERKDDGMARAKDAVQAHVRRGAIAPEEKMASGKLAVDYWAEQYMASAADAEAVMSRLPGKGPRRTIANPGQAGSQVASASGSPADEIMASAKDMRQKQPDDFRTDAGALIAVCRTPAGYAKYREFMDGTARKN